MMPIQYDILWINAEPHAGTEMGGHNPKKHNTFRPFVVCSNRYYNRSGSVVGFAITSQHPLNAVDSILIPVGTIHKHIHGFIIPFGMYGYDYKARQGKVIDHLDKKTINKVRLVIKDVFSI